MTEPAQRPDAPESRATARTRRATSGCRERRRVPARRCPPRGRGPRPHRRRRRPRSPAPLAGRVADRQAAASGPPAGTDAVVQLAGDGAAARGLGAGGPVATPVAVGGADRAAAADHRRHRRLAAAPPAGRLTRANYRGRVNRRPPAGWSPRGRPRTTPPPTESATRPPRQGRQPLQATGVRLPVRRDLRRYPLRVGLRAAGRRAQGEHQEAVVAHRRPEPGRHRGPGLLGDPAAPGLGGLRSRRRLHRPADRVPELPQALPGRPPRGGLRGAEGPARPRTAWPTSPARTAARRARGPSRATST